MSYFNDKVIWITGASNGIGKALALYLSQFNCKLILSARRESELHRVKAQCETPENVKVISFDLKDFNVMQDIASQAVLSAWLA